MNTLYPFQSHFLDLSGHQYHYLNEGKKENPVLLMVHGNPTWSFYYRELVKHLCGEFRVIVPDHMGSGYSDKPTEYNYTLQQHIINLAKLIDYLQLEDITIFMHDWGGPISMGYAVQYPQNVKRMVVFNTAAFWMPQVHPGLKILRNTRLGAYLVRKLNVFVWSGITLASRKKMPDAVKAGYLKPYDSFENRVGVLAFIKDIPMEQEGPTYELLQAIEEKLALLKEKPMMIIWGEKDPVFTLEFLDKWKEYFPNAAIKQLPEAGHYVVEDAVEDIQKIVDKFLKQEVATGTSVEDAPEGKQEAETSVSLVIKPEGEQEGHTTDE